MLRKIALISGIALSLLMLVSCGEKKLVHCDNCTTELAIDEDSSMDDEWIIYCEPCSEELFPEDII